jgi:1,4-dihydroxy-2-naphthoate octaprenyltransferase
LGWESPIFAAGAGAVVARHQRGRFGVSSVVSSFVAPMRRHGWGSRRCIPTVACCCTQRRMLTPVNHTAADCGELSRVQTMQVHSIEKAGDSPSDHPTGAPPVDASIAPVAARGVGARAMMDPATVVEAEVNGSSRSERAPPTAQRATVSPLRAWVVATRPHTLTIAVNPVLVGCSMAWAETRHVDPVWMLLALLGALLLQTGTNLDNDVSDFERGTDKGGRLGLPRATAQGLLTARQVRNASRICFAFATLIGLAMVARGGWPILVAGIASAAAAMAYSGGPRPISYTPFGDFVVWLFFGLIAVSGSYYLQTFAVTPGVLLAATMVGLPAAAVLVVNNYRDLEPDARVGKRTLAVCLGRRFTRWEYVVLMLAPFALLMPLALLSRPRVALLLPLAALPLALALVRRFWRETPGPAFNTLLARTARFQVLFALLLCAALMLG